MATFNINTGGIVYYDSLTGGSTNATLDNYIISNGSTLVVRTDSYACPNHSTAFGSLDNVSFSGTGGTLRFDPTYVRVISFTDGAGTVPAYGTTISQGSVSGVFLGVWANWQSDPIEPGSAMPSSGFIKIGGKVGGNFTAGALTGITAVCSGPDVQGWIEVRGPENATIIIPRIGRMESIEAWFEIGITNGTRGQIIPCPTTATNASIFPGVWIETAPGSGIYEPYASVGSITASTAYRTDASMKVIVQSTAGIHIGSDGTNGVFFLPPAGCRVRIPAIILTNCIRSASGSGPRVIPNSSLPTRQELITTNAGYIDMRGAVIQWYMNITQAFFVRFKSCAINDTIVLSRIATPIDIDNCIVAPTINQVNFALNMTSCFAGGTIKNSVFNRYSLASSATFVASLNNITGVSFENVIFRSSVLRANINTGCITASRAINCNFMNIILIGGRGLFNASQNCSFSNTTYYDHISNSTTTNVNPMYGLEFSQSNNITIEGFNMPIPAVGPFSGLISIGSCFNTLIRNIGSNYSNPLVMNASVTGVILNSAGNNNGITMKRCYVSNTRIGPYVFVNNDTDVLLEHVAGDVSDTSVIVSLNTIAKNCLVSPSPSGQTAVYGTHWLTRFTGPTSGVIEIMCNEPTEKSISQCYISGGSPQFNSLGQVLLTKVGDQVTWETPFNIIGFTAFANIAPTITGTNVTFSSGSTWGNHSIEYQIVTNSGSTPWLPLNAASLITNTINSSSGFKLKIRATCIIGNPNNAITNIRIAMMTTETVRNNSLYPLVTIPITLTGLKPDSEIRAYVGTLSSPETAIEIAGTESSGINFTFEHSYPNTPGYIQIFHVDYQPVIIELNYPTIAQTIPIRQIPDRQYSRGSIFTPG